ncbi:exo-beta-N-acetylmuramidase NamZ family protein, partial [Pedobacter sp.]|uniref:exo-beta-N-acetylmuramidase NamZ family protein n=1 Tax=Pedobacter sp. TaxID=1411316 RepID=UPI003D7F542A
MNSTLSLFVNLTFTALTLQACGTKKPFPLQAGVPNPYTIKAENIDPPKDTKMLTGAEQTDKYLPILKGKRVGMVVNPTSIIGNQTAVDSLLKLGVNIVKIFGPEHGFRGNASAGIHVADDVDAKTGIKAVSLYGAHHTPTAADLADVDIMVFDIQDVGVRFYTYINTLQRVMEACAENKKQLVILDRPNPNGFYIDGPILDPKLVSGIGMQAIPIVHGLTVAEYALMLNGEGWLKNKVKCELNIIKVAN